MSESAPPDLRTGIPRRRARGEEAWRLRDERGRVWSCELRVDAATGAGWEVLLLLHDEPQVSRRCAARQAANFVAAALKQDSLRGGWRDSSAESRHHGDAEESDVSRRG